MSRKLPPLPDEVICGIPIKKAHQILEAWADTDEGYAWINGDREEINYMEIETIQPCIDCDRDVAYSYDVEAYIHIQEPETECHFNGFGREHRGGVTKPSKEVFRFINRDKWDWDKEI